MAGELALQAGLIGFTLGLPGIFSIGPQNLRVLNAGLTAAHPGAVATIAFLSEILLVAAGIGGLGLSLATRPDAVALLQAAGAAFVACAPPPVPPAPALFSINTRVPTCVSSWAARGRAMASVPPPAAKATMRMIGFCGHD